MRQLQYNASEFPVFQFGHVLPPKISPVTLRNPELRDCLSSAIYLTSQIELVQGSVNLRAEPIRGAYFRAALSEMVRVEDVSVTQGIDLKFIHTSDPLLHTIKLLRNYQVHIGVCRLSAGAVNVLWGDEPGRYESFIASNLSSQELRKLDCSKGYTNNQLEELVLLFEAHQRKLGVVQLLYSTCLHICSLIAKA